MSVKPEQSLAIDIGVLREKHATIQAIITPYRPLADRIL